MQMMRRGAKGAGAFAFQVPLYSGEGSRIKQQQKHHPLGDLWPPSPSLPEIRFLPPTPPLQPLMASARPPTFLGVRYGLQGAALCPDLGIHSPSF
jgi:hypothetical protein